MKKKTGIIIAAALFMLSFVACGENTPASPTSQSVTESVEQKEAQTSIADTGAAKVETQASTSDTGNVENENNRPAEEKTVKYPTVSVKKDNNGAADFIFDFTDVIIEDGYQNYSPDFNIDDLHVMQLWFSNDWDNAYAIVLQKEPGNHQLCFIQEPKNHANVGEGEFEINNNVLSLHMNFKGSGFSLDSVNGTVILMCNMDWPDFTCNYFEQQYEWNDIATSGGSAQASSSEPVQEEKDWNKALVGRWECFISRDPAKDQPYNEYRGYIFYENGKYVFFQRASYDISSASDGRALMNEKTQNGPGSKDIYSYDGKELVRGDDGGGDVVPVTLDGDTFIESGKYTFTKISD